jgi:WD40 repeat protein
MGAGTITAWNLRTKQVDRDLSVKGYTLSGIATGDGFVASGGSPWTGAGEFLVLVWSLESWTLVHRLGEGMALSEAAQSFAFHHPTGHLITGHAGGSVYVWDLDTGEPLRVVTGRTGGERTEALAADLMGFRGLTAHTSAVESLAAHPVLPYVVSGGGDHAIRIWNLSTGVCLRTLHGHQDEVRSVALSADGTRLVSGSRDGDIRLWTLGELPTAPRRWAVCTTSGATEAAMHRNRFDDLAAAARRALDEEDWPSAAALATRAREVPGMERHRDGLRLWQDVTRHGRAVQLRSVWTAAELPGHAMAITSVALDADGDKAVSASEDGLIKVWDLKTGDLTRTMEGHDGSVQAVALLADGEQVTSGGFDGTWRLWRIGDNRPGRVLHAGKRTVDAVAATPDGRYLIAAENATIRNPLRRVLGGEVSSLRKPVLRVHDLLEGSSFTLGSHSAKCFITDLAPTPDGSGVVVSQVVLTKKPAGFDLHGVLRWFDLDERRCVHEFDAEEFPPVAVAMALDGHRVVAVSWGRRIAVWKTGRSAPVHVIDDVRRGMPNLRDIRPLAVRVDGFQAVTGCDDGRLRIWDLEQSSLTRDVQAHPKDAAALAMSRAGHVVVSGGDDGKLRVWGLDWDYQFPPAGDLHRAALPYLEAFRNLQERLRLAINAGSAQDWLGDVGYGWIRRDAIARWLASR